ncbi:chemotaxis protein CheB [Ideonella sp. DXS29W]|uniref:protein-glutamate methylesterase n=1 Tax=Ideonella lacteola TaxID=2984193 RepID=A0ABU9BST3_9BURK
MSAALAGASALPGAAPRREPFRAVAIGTSAGGIDALAALLPCLPTGATLSVFIVVHLPPSVPSLLCDIFRPKCALRVMEAEDKCPVEPGTLYFAPPNYHLLIDPGPQLALSIDPAVHFSRPAIDVLFESAADIYRQYLLGIVLTGASEDGARGLLAVHRAGGAVVVQSPDTAMAPAMPLHAIRRCPEAAVLTLNDIGKLLQEAARGSAG